MHVNTCTIIIADDGRRDGI